VFEASNTSTVGGAAQITVTAPSDGGVIDADHVLVRGTVTPSKATVQILGQTAQVANGVFAGSAALHGGKNTIDVVASAPGATPASTTVTVTRLSHSQTAPHTTPQGSTTTTTAQHLASPSEGQPHGLIVQFGAFRTIPDAQALAASLAGRGIHVDIINSNDYATSPAAPLGLWLVISKAFADGASARAYAASSGVSGAFPRTITPHQ
jgi:cell division septation protein DedD